MGAVRVLKDKLLAYFKEHDYAFESELKEKFPNMNLALALDLLCDEGVLSNDGDTGHDRLFVYIKPRNTDNNFVLNSNSVDGMDGIFNIFGMPESRYAGVMDAYPSGITALNDRCFLQGNISEADLDFLLQIIDLHFEYLKLIKKEVCKMVWENDTVINVAFFSTMLKPELNHIAKVRALYHADILAILKSIPMKNISAGSKAYRNLKQYLLEYADEVNRLGGENVTLDTGDRVSQPIPDCKEFITAVQSFFSSSITK